MSDRGAKSFARQYLENTGRLLHRQMSGGRERYKAKADFRKAALEDDPLLGIMEPQSRWTHDILRKVLNQYKLKDISPELAKKLEKLFFNMKGVADISREGGRTFLTSGVGKTQYVRNPQTGEIIKIPGRGMREVRRASDRLMGRLRQLMRVSAQYDPEG